MRLLIHASQSVASYVSVDLRGPYIGVPEQLLDRSQIGTAFEEMSGKRMSERMRMQGATVGQREPIQDATRITRSEAMPSSVHEQRVRGVVQEC